MVLYPVHTNHRPETVRILLPFCTSGRHSRMISRANESALEEQPVPVNLEIDLEEHPEEHPSTEASGDDLVMSVTHHLLFNGRE